MLSESDEEPDCKPKPEYHRILKERLRHVEGDTSLKSLKTWSLDCIKSNTDFFLHIDQSTGLNPFDQLPNSLKIELLGADKIHWQWGRWEQLLVNSQLTKLHVGLDPEKDFEATMNFCSSLMTVVPKLVKFEWISPFRTTLLGESLLPIIYVTSTPSFKNLQVLWLTYFTCTDLHLQMIATHIKELRVLRLKFDKGVTSKGISALSALKHLEEFPFHLYSCYIPNEIYNFCLQHLPKLQVVGDEQVDLETVHRCSMIDADDFEIDFESIPAPNELGLRQMVLTSNGQLIIPEGITFPNLTSLILVHPLENFRLDANRFSKVTELGLFELGMDHYLRILKIMGHQTRLLAIMEQNEDLLLDLILRLCPNLEKFHIAMSPERLTLTTPMEPETDLSNLKELRIDLDNDADRKIAKLAPGVLMQLLRAPNLRWIKLYCVDLTKVEAELIIGLVRKGQILQKLEVLVVEHVNLSGESLTEEMRNRYDLVVENIARFCPHFLRFEDIEF